MNIKFLESNYSLQFVAENTIVDNFNNYLYYWGIADNKYMPVLKGTHYVAGMLYDNKYFDLRLEGFYKKTEGLHRYYQPEKMETIAGSIGSSRSYGVDCYINKEIKKHDFSHFSKPLVGKVQILIFVPMIHFKQKYPPGKLVCYTKNVEP